MLYVQYYVLIISYLVIVFKPVLAWGDLGEDKGVIGGNTFPFGLRFGGVTLVVSELKVFKTGWVFENRLLVLLEKFSEFSKVKKNLKAPFIVLSSV